MPSVLASARRFILKYPNRFIDVAAALLISPRQFARRHIHLGDRRSVRRALGFFATAVSAAIVLDRIGLSLLGGTTFSEINYWIVLLVASCLFIVLVSLLLSIGRGFQLANVAHIALYPIGAGLLIGGLLLSAAALTVFLLRRAEYIPDYILDPGEFDNFVPVWAKAYLECVARENRIFAIALNSDGAIGMVAAPFQYLLFLNTAAVLVYLGAMAIIAADLLKRSLLLVGLVFCSSTIAVIGGYLLGIMALTNHVSATTDCEDRATEAANTKTLDSLLQMSVQNNLSPLIGREGAWGRLVDVSIENRSVLIYFVVPPGSAERHSGQLDAMRNKAIATYCASSGPPWELYREKGIALTHIFRLPDGEHVGTFSVNRDECRR